MKYVPASDWVQYGPANFLWFSDIALFTTLVALWSENRLLVSMQAVAVLVLELLWCVDLLVGLLSGVFVIGLSPYMLDPDIPLFIRGLSLFHVVLPILFVWMLWRFGYDPRALALQTLVAWVVLPLCYLATDPRKNINWVFGIGEHTPQTWMPPDAYFALVMVLIPACAYVPTHVVLKKLFARPHPPSQASLTT
jgi:hypothetical protein